MRLPDPARRPLVACVAAALLTAGSAGATGAEPADSKTKANDVSGVTVTAPEKADPLVNPASQFVRQHLPQGTFSEQFPRFRDPVCVRVVGLPDEYNAFIARRVGEVAAEVHAAVATEATCKPNVHVIFTTEPQALVKDIAKRKDILLGFYWNANDLKRLSTFKSAIGGWYVTATRDQFGENRLEKHDPTDYLSPRTGRAGSRLSNGMSAELEHSLIIGDTNRIAGEKIGAVADYVAVLALAKWQGMERCNKIPTILNLIADGCDPESAPEGATSSDLALLTALYAVDPRESGSQQRMAIASHMDRALKTSGDQKAAH